MKPFAVIFVLVAGCATDDNHPIEPGGGGHVSTGGGGGAQMVSGRVCRALDLLALDTCATTGLAGLNVTLGNASTVTRDDGTFSMPAPTGSLLAFTVSGTGAITTTTPFSPSTTVPVVDADAFAAMLASNQITLPSNSGTILGTVVRKGMPATGVSVLSTPESAFTPLFDTETGFGGTTTGTRGVFLVPGVAVGATSLAFSPGETTVDGISVVNGGVTILDSVGLP